MPEHTEIRDRVCGCGEETVNAEAHPDENRDPAGIKDAKCNIRALYRPEISELTFAIPLRIPPGPAEELRKCTAWGGDKQLVEERLRRHRPFLPDASQAQHAEERREGDKEIHDRIAMEHHSIVKRVFPAAEGLENQSPQNG
jgi:hypothetical protein